jgi:hypothetical protein
MHLVRIFLASVFSFFSQAALAGMVWAAVAVDVSNAAKLKTNAQLVENLLDDEAPKGRSIYLDKAWHGIHFLLTGSSGPTKSLESKVIFGGKPVGADQGYGPAQLLSPGEVQDIAKLLENYPPEVLVSRYNPKAMETAQIYPSIIWVREGPEALNYVLQFYSQLVSFYKAAAERGDAVLLVVH